MGNTLKEVIFRMKDKLMLFHLMDEVEMEQIVDYFELVLYREGTVLYDEGEDADFIGFIASGVIEVKKQTEFKGKRIVLATLKKGSFVGEMSMINSNEHRFTTAAALKNSELLILKRESLEALILKYPYIGTKILRGLNQILTIRLRKTLERLTAIF